MNYTQRTERYWDMVYARHRAMVRMFGEKNHGAVNPSTLWNNRVHKCDCSKVISEIIGNDYRNSRARKRKIHAGD